MRAVLSCMSVDTYLIMGGTSQYSLESYGLNINVYNHMHPDS